MSVEFTLEDIDLGYEAMSEALAEMAGAVIETGLFDREQASKGAWNEFGTSSIPARPWLSVVADNNKPALGDAMVTATDEALDGTPVMTALMMAGDTCADIAKSILGTGDVGGPPLAPSTVAAKGNAAKLVDTGAMRDAIESKVEVKR